MNSLIIGIVSIVLVLVVIYLIANRLSKTKKAAKGSELFPGQFDDPSDALISNVRFEHVEALIKRDFPTERHTEVTDALSKYTKGYKATVYHIILQEAKGDVSKIIEYVMIANEVGDFRDLAQALISLKSK